MNLQGTIPLYCFAHHGLPAISRMGAFDASVVCVFIGSLQNHIIRFVLIHKKVHCLQSELNNLQWQDVQKRLIEVQKVHEMCVHKEELTELGTFITLHCLCLVHIFIQG